jgi:hypothetical protein
LLRKADLPRRPDVNTDDYPGARADRPREMADRSRGELRAERRDPADDATLAVYNVADFERVSATATARFQTTTKVTRDATEQSAAVS